MGNTLTASECLWPRHETVFNPVINFETRGQQNHDGWFCLVLFFALDFCLISVHIQDTQCSILFYVIWKIFWYSFFPDFEVEAFFPFHHFILLFTILMNCCLKPLKPWWDYWSFSIRGDVLFCCFSISITRSGDFHLLLFILAVSR